MSVYMYVYVHIYLLVWNKQNWPVSGEETSAPCLESVWGFPRSSTHLHQESQLYWNRELHM